MNPVIGQQPQQKQSGGYQIQTTHSKTAKRSSKSRRPGNIGEGAAGTAQSEFHRIMSLFQ